MKVTSQSWAEQEAEGQGVVAGPRPPWRPGQEGFLQPLFPDCKLEHLGPGPTSAQSSCDPDKSELGSRWSLRKVVGGQWVQGTVCPR